VHPGGALRAVKVAAVDDDRAPAQQRLLAGSLALFARAEDVLFFCFGCEFVCGCGEWVCILAGVGFCVVACG
jgi:hypothetical protein